MLNLCCSVAKKPAPDKWYYFSSVSLNCLQFSFRPGYEIIKPHTWTRPLLLFVEIHPPLPSSLLTSSSFLFFLVLVMRWGERLNHWSSLMNSIGQLSENHCFSDLFFLRGPHSILYYTTSHCHGNGLKMKSSQISGSGNNESFVKIHGVTMNFTHGCV